MSFSKVLALCLFLISFYLTGCTSDNTTSSTEKVFHFGTTAYGIEMGNTGLNPMIIPAGQQFAMVLAKLYLNLMIKCNLNHDWLKVMNN